MGDQFIKRFAVIFSVLVLLQETQGRISRIESDTNNISNNPIFEDTAAVSPKNVLHDKEVFNTPNVVHMPIKDESSNQAVYIKSKGEIYQNKKRQKRLAGIITLLVTGVSVAISVYKAARGCKDVSPRLEPNIRRIKGLQKQAIAKRDRINSNWKKVLTTESFYSKLDNSMTVLQAAVSRLDILQREIVKLLDSAVFAKIDLERRKIENAVDNNNGSAITNPKALEDRFFTPMSLALELSAKMAPIALWLGPNLLPKISKSISKRMAGKWSSSNPGRMKKIFNNFKLKGIFPNARASFKSWITKIPGIGKIKAAFTFSRNTKLGFQLVKKGITKVASAALTGIFIAYDIFDTWKFIKDCKKKQKLSYDAINDITGSIRKMNDLSHRMTVFKNHVEGSYTKMLDQLKAKDFRIFVAEVRDTAKNAQTQTRQLESAALKLQRFLDQIDSTVSYGVTNYAQVQSLVDSLLGGFHETNFKLDCYRKKLSIIVSITSNCANGNGDYASLWKQAVKLQGVSLNDCVAKQQYLSMDEVKTVIQGFMQVKKKSEICLRNDLSKQAMVCNNWYNDLDDISNRDKVTGVTLSDVRYFISKCPPGDVNVKMGSVICEKKLQNKILNEVVKYYHKFNHEQLTKVYDGCKLSILQKENICRQKKEGQVLPYVQKIYTLYKPVFVKQIFESCVYKMEPGDIKRICSMVKLVSHGDVSHAIHAADVKLFGIAAVKSLIHKIC